MFASDSDRLGWVRMTGCITYRMGVLLRGRERIIELEGGLARLPPSGRMQGKICIDMCDNFLLYGKKLSFHLRREGVFNTADLKDVKPEKYPNGDL